MLQPSHFLKVKSKLRLDFCHDWWVHWQYYRLATLLENDIEVIIFYIFKRQRRLWGLCITLSSLKAGRCDQPLKTKQKGRFNKTGDDLWAQIKQNTQTRRRPANDVTSAFALKVAVACQRHALFQLFHFLPHYTLILHISRRSQKSATTQTNNKKYYLAIKILPDKSLPPVINRPFTQIKNKIQPIV